MTECERNGLAMNDETLDTIIARLLEVGIELAAYQPRFIVDQFLATFRFLGEEPHYDPRFLEYAIDNIRVHRQSPAPAGGETTKPNH